jgi:hypothetical protein
MKKIFYSIMILLSMTVVFSCSNEDNSKIIDEIENETFAPVTLSLTASMSMSEVETKSTSFPLNKYLLDYIFLAVPNGGGTLKFDVVGENKEFEINLASKKAGFIEISSNYGTLEVPDGTQLYFTSEEACCVNAQPNTAGLVTPNGNVAYEGHGHDVYKSEWFKLKSVTEGFEFLGETYYKDALNKFNLLMYRMTGVFQVRLVMFKNDVNNNPLPVNAADFTELLPYTLEQWRVTPFLTNYPLNFNLDVFNINSEPSTPLALGTYVLVDHKLPFATETIVMPHGTIPGETVILENTQTATCKDSCPSIFNGSLSQYESAIQLVIEDSDGNRRIAKIKLPEDNIRKNDYKVLNVGLNII